MVSTKRNGQLVSKTLCILRVCRSVAVVVALWFGVAAAETLAQSSEQTTSFLGKERIGASAEVVNLKPAAREAIGLEVTSVEQSKLPLEIVTTGAIEAIPTKTYIQHGLLSGRVYDVLVEQGDMVKEGQTLVILDSPEINRLGAEVLNTKNDMQLEITKVKSNYNADRNQAQVRLDLAKSNYERMKTLYEEKIASRRSIEAATVDLRVAESRLENIKKKETAELDSLKIKMKVTIESMTNRLKQIGLDDKTINQMLDSDYSILRVPIRSSRAGVVVDIQANPGETVSDNDPLFEVLDIATVYATADVYEHDMDRVEEGQKVVVTANAIPKKTFEGTITFVGSEVDKTKRTLPVRVKISNPGFKLKPDMFVSLRIQTQEPATSIILPKEAVIERTGHFGVFLEVKPGVYQLNYVQVGRSLGDEIEILDGLKVGQKVVTTGAFQLDAHLLKSKSTDLFSHPTETEHHHDHGGAEHDDHEQSKWNPAVILVIVGAMVFGGLVTAVVMKSSARGRIKEEEKLTAVSREIPDSSTEVSDERTRGRRQ